MAATIRPLAPHLFLVVLSTPIDGFDDFIGTWLVKRQDSVYLVDVGPAVSADLLIDAITTLGVSHLDYICLTHIHLDHAGAIGHLSRRFPDAPIVCHPKGAAHLVDPERLWQGTVKTLGETGRAYGRMLAIDSSILARPDQLAAAPFRLIDTPGHSPHHYAIADEDYLFVGEAGGVCLPLPSGDIYLRPATPPRFFLETSLASIDRLMETNPKTLCYGHLGIRRDGMAMLGKHRDQLLLWKRILTDRVAGAIDDPLSIADQWVDVLLEEDPLLFGFGQLPTAIQARERSFLLNSVKGFVGYLTSRAA
jgi:glyoxylase-like metal-dependent hydrolase (beta-lactamase superfamily II)